MIDGVKLLIINNLLGQQKKVQKIEHGYCGYLIRRRMVVYEVQALNHGGLKSQG
jgi:hypothetical protein